MTRRLAMAGPARGGRVRRIMLAPLAAVMLLLLAVAPARAVDVERVVSGSGIEAWLVHDASLPIVTINLAFRGGAAHDPTGREGLANMAMSLLDEGAGDLDSQAFQRRLEERSISFSFDASLDALYGNMRTLAENRDVAFDLLRLALTQPRFDAQPVERVRSQILVRLKQKEEDPDSVAHEILMRALFPGHPYGRPVAGTLASVAAITDADLKGYVAGRLARDNLIIGVVGDITAAELKPLLDKTFGALPAKSAPRTVADTPPEADGKTTVVAKAVPQSAILFGHGGPKRHAEDFYAAFVLNHIIGGGGFTSRLYSEVREKRGLAYSVYSYLSPLDHAGLILGGAGTANERVAETLAQVREIWRGTVERGVSEAELNDAKTYLTGSFPLRFTSSRGIAGMLVAMQMDDLGIDYIDRRNSLIEAVTRADVNRAARRYLDPDKLTVVVAGRPVDMPATR